MRIRPVGAHALLLDCAEPEVGSGESGTGDATPEVGSDGELGSGESEVGSVAPEVGSGEDVGSRVEAWRAELWRRREAGELDVVEIVPAATTVLLDGLADPAAAAARIASWAPRPSPAPAVTTPVPAVTAPAVTAPAVTAPGAPGGLGAGPTTGSGPATASWSGIGSGQVRTVEVPVRYDGEDLPVVADHWGVNVAEVVRRLTETAFRVAFCGFAPGFGYLTGLPEQWAVPRLATPRTRVPAGSVALAGRYAGIYPTASPGGWLLVGRTDLPMFDPHADPPATLSPGMQVRLVAA
ncbi:5-oxoprolinase subunit B family protein [Micromonospora cathayae]|uniref:Allophanate hydrolase subunit 1 n=1 Tax=Micromonospora cathayae TaxID=3028804 RepID=A0ABY7ZVF9_9ACTN|nr:allophanate hydrolase subunit 1 [Micromonospora sp. HUAS 3]WDZ86112.1 allophanate hydrolase subunit 1 [Micromonospora sp. HUAS 3]